MSDPVTGWHGRRGCVAMAGYHINGNLTVSVQLLALAMLEAKAQHNSSIG